MSVAADSLADNPFVSTRTAREVLLSAKGASQSRERIREPFRAVVPDRASMGEIVLAGSGAWGRETARRLAVVGVPAAAFLDNAERAWGTTAEGLPVLSPTNAIGRFGVDALYVVTIYNGAAVKRQLTAAGCRRVISAQDFYFGLSEGFIPYYQLDWPDAMFAAATTIGAVDDSWHDEVSRRVFSRQLARRAGFPASPDEPVGSSRDCYFDPNLFQVQSTDCVVDCGAFDGDTIRQLVGGQRVLPRKIVALEPDPGNAAALRRFLIASGSTVADRVDVVEAAASSESGHIAFNASGTVAARTGTGSGRVATIALDDLDASRLPTVVKMDIEGHEFEALQGAREVMRRGAAVLSISLYHRLDDLWRIPALIHASNPDYRLFLRCYAEGGWESVCYAVPAARLLKGER